MAKSAPVMLPVRSLASTNGQVGDLVGPGEASGDSACGDLRGDCLGVGAAGSGNCLRHAIGTEPQPGRDRVRG